MKETTRIIALFEKLYDGDSWIGESLMGTVKKLSAENAAKKTAPWNSIWEILRHIIQYRENVLLRVQGSRPQVPQDNYFTAISDQSQQAWEETLQQLKASETNWTKFLETMDDADLETIYEPNGASYYHNIHGLLQHDAYHLGQIILLAKLHG